MADLEFALGERPIQTVSLAGAEPTLHPQLCEVVRHLAGVLSGRGGHGMVVIGIGDFCRGGFLDESRIAGCPTRELTAAGAVSPCLLYSKSFT